MAADTCTKCTVNCQEHTHHSKDAELLYCFIYDGGMLVFFSQCHIHYALIIKEQCWTEELLNHTPVCNISCISIIVKCSSASIYSIPTVYLRAQTGWLGRRRVTHVDPSCQCLKPPRFQLSDRHHSQSASRPAGSICICF